MHRAGASCCQGGLWRTDGDLAPAPVNYDAQNVGIGRVLQTVLALPDGGLWVPVPTRGLAYLRSDWRRIAAFSPAQGLGGGLYRGISQAGADGVIASPQEAALIRALPEARGKLIVTPGVRPAGAAQGDQKRIATPAQAIADGADHIVVGRPIWQADDPAAAARAIVAGLG